MSDASDRLARSRLAIIEQIERRERPRGARNAERERARAQGTEWDESHRGGGWFGSVKHAIGTWWRHHPAHMGLELAAPVLSSYASRKPLQYLVIAAAVGAVVAIARPWRLISATGLAMALVKSSQLSSLVMSAMSAADFPKDRRPFP